MPYIVALITLVVFAAASRFGMSANLVASVFVGLVWATFAGVLTFLWQRGWFGMLERNKSVLLANVVILGATLIGVPMIGGISQEARMLIQLLVLGTGAAGQAMGWLYSYHTEEASASRRK